MSGVLKEDINSVINYDLPWSDLENTSVLVTGATGLIGNLLVKVLQQANKVHALNLNIIVLVRNTKEAQLKLNDYNIQFIESDIRKPIKYNGKIDYIIHCAAVTKSKEMVTFPVENIQTALFGTDNILNLAREHSVKSFVYLSSMEVYGALSSDKETVTENQLGYIDLTNPRSCYSEGKRMCENLCFCYFNEYKVPIKIARLAQTFGAGISENESRVFAQFARSAIFGENIVLHTDGSSFGNYCYTSDAIKGILLLLLKGMNGEAYNISNEATNMTIRDMAELVANKIAGGRISVVLDIPEDSTKLGYPPAVKMKLSSEKIRKLGWQPSYNLEEMYRRMIEEFEYDK